MYVSDYEILKWKGPQEHQPASSANFLESCERLKRSVEFDQEIKETFLTIADIINDISENIPAQKIQKKLNKNKAKPELKDSKRGKYLSKFDKGKNLLN